VARRRAGWIYRTDLEKGRDRTGRPCEARGWQYTPRPFGEKEITQLMFDPDYVEIDYAGMKIVAKKCPTHRRTQVLHGMAGHAEIDDLRRRLAAAHESFRP
jgi:hypothetical protein